MSRAPGRVPITPPTATGVLTLLLSIGLALISLRASNRWLLCVACALFAPVLISQLLRPKLRSISVCFRAPDRVVVGQVVEHVFHAHNRGRRSTPAFRLTHFLDGFEVTSLAVPGLAPGGRAGLTISRVATTRGVADQHTVRLRTTAPFGMAVYRRRILATARIIVHPARGPVAELSGLAAGELPGGRPARSGHDLHGLREWRRGDPLGQVHWRATARHDRLTVVIPEAAVQSRFALVVSGSPGDEEWEALVSTAAWTVVEAVRHGRRSVRLSAAGVLEYVGHNHELILDWFARLQLYPPALIEMLEAAADWAGPDGLIVVATTGSVPAAAVDAARGLVILDPAGRAMVA